MLTKKWALAFSNKRGNNIQRTNNNNGGRLPYLIIKLFLTRWELYIWPSLTWKRNFKRIFLEELRHKDGFTSVVVSAARNKRGDDTRTYDDEGGWWGWSGGGRGDGDEEMNTGEQSLCAGSGSLAFSAVISDSPPAHKFPKNSLHSYYWERDRSCTTVDRWTIDFTREVVLQKLLQDP